MTVSAPYMASWQKPSPPNSMDTNNGRLSSADKIRRILSLRSSLRPPASGSLPSPWRVAPKPAPSIVFRMSATLEWASS
ncbi:hypothetical protein D3C75_802720 [compost metagenome]